MEIKLEKVGPTFLSGVSDEDKEVLRNLNYGEILSLKGKTLNNPVFHRKLMKLLDVAYNNQEKYEDKKHFVDELKLQAGWYAQHVRLSGEMVLIPKSLSFDDCDDTQRRILYDKFLSIIMRDYLGNMDDEEFIRLYGNFL